MIRHLQAVWRARYFWGSLVQLDFRNRYRRSLLGVGWSMLHPLALTVVFCVAFGTIMGVADWRTYAPRLMAGLAVWNFIKDSLVLGCDAFVRGEAYIRQTPLPFSIYPLRVMLGTFIHFMISLGLAVLTVAVLSESADVFSRLPQLVPAVVLLVVFCWGLATIAAFAGAYFHDTKHLLEILTQLLFFLTPIMYMPVVVVEKIGPWMIEMNPVAHFLQLISYPLADGAAVPDGLYATTALLTTAAFGLACCTLAWLQKRLIFQL